MTCAMSTYAMTLYNLVQLAGGRARLRELHLAARDKAHRELDEITAEAALEALVERRYLTRDGESGEYVTRDPQLRVINARDRREPDGWKGWRNAHTGFEIAEVLA